jgi:hypothetical protein
MAEKLTSNDETLSDGPLGAVVAGEEEGEDPVVGVCAAVVAVVAGGEDVLLLLLQAAAIRPTPIASAAKARVLRTD